MPDGTMTPSVDLWSATPTQPISSARTCVRTLPRLFRRSAFLPGSVNADIGGGRFDNATVWLDALGIENLVFDPYNRDAAHNLAVSVRVRGGQVATATVANVLNVIREVEARAWVVALAADAVGAGGVAYFQVYEGNRSGVGRETKRGWQENRRLADYVDEIGTRFSVVELRKGFIAARNPATR